MDAEGVKKSAILLLSLGSDVAAEVCKYLSPKEVQRIGEEMAMIGGISRDVMSEVLIDFHKLAGERTSIGTDSAEYIKTLMTKALGEDKANNVLNRILKGSDTSGIEGLKWMDAPSVAELIRNEHPQIIATILVHLERDQASDILKCFSDSLRNDTMLRIATLDGIQPGALKELNDVMHNLMSGGNTMKESALGGVKVAADILNYMGSTLEASTLEGIRTHDADLAQQLLDNMFVFDNLMDVDNKGIQLLLREIPSESLIVALKGASQGLKDKFLQNMSTRAREGLVDDMDSKGPVRLSEVEAEQKEILKIVRRLSEEGLIAVAGKGEESYV
jgi:flagellar motor switch protein FliG